LDLPTITPITEDFRLIITITIMEFSELLIITMFSMLLEVTSMLIEISLLMPMET